MDYDQGDEIGRDGFGIVYEAVRSDGNRYAIKQLNPLAFFENDQEMLVRSFERKVRYQQSEDHPHVVPVVEANLDDKPPWFLMPLAEGSLKDDLEVDHTLGGDPSVPNLQVYPMSLEPLLANPQSHRKIILPIKDAA